MQKNLYKSQIGFKWNPSGINKNAGACPFWHLSYNGGDGKAFSAYIPVNPSNS
jgi:L,D-peptidoglycan transpeptidase YkuD (ErfK/YbiS/YcfS/YnhG family)